MPVYVHANLLLVVLVKLRNLKQYPVLPQRKHVPQELVIGLLEPVLRHKAHI